MSDAKERFLSEYREAYPKELTGAYDILECLRHGEGAETLFARSRADGRKVVIKCYNKAHPLFSAEETALQARLKHPFIPAFIETWENETSCFVIREYIEGQTLAEYVCSHALTEQEVIDIGIRLCDILQYLHRLTPPVLHRDIKPQNIIRKEDGSVFLIDFGIARSFTEEKDTDTVWCGTRGYAAPEQYGYMQTGAYSDIYSLGVVLNWMIKEGTANLEPSASLAKVLSKCTAFAPEDRYQDAEEVGRRLRELLPEQSRKRKMKKGLLLSTLFLTVIMVLALMLLLYRKLHQGEVHFQEPLIEEAVRVMLDKPDEILTKQDLEQVTQLYIMGNTIYLSEEDMWAGSEGWEEAACPYGDITSIEDLAEMPNMRNVMIWGEHIEDISPLEELYDLQLIDFRQNDISDLSALADKRQLAHIGFNSNPLQDISALGSCPELKGIDFNNTGKGYSGEAFLEIGDLDFLDVANGADVYQYLEGKTIGEFKTGSPYQTDLKGIEKITIRKLVIYYSEIMDLSVLTGREDISYLDMGVCSMKDASPLLTMPNLQIVAASGRDRQKLEKLAEQEGLLFTIEYTD